MRIKIPGSEKLDQKIKTILALETITYNNFINNDANDSSNANKLGYSILQVKYNSDNGYNAIAYQNIKTKDIVIAHQGTTGSFGVKTSIFYTIFLAFDIVLDLINDLLLSFNQKPYQSDDAYDFIKEIKTKHPDSNIIQIGYSLGGNLAEYCYAKSNGRIETYCFESPGLGAIPKIDPEIDKLFSNNKLPIYYYNGLGPNIINSPLAHISTELNSDSDQNIGEFYKIFFPIKLNDSSISLLKYFTLSVDGHVGIREENNEFLVKKVDSWPVGAHRALEYFFSRENKDEWRILLDSYWQDICSDIDLNSDEGLAKFDEFFDYFAKNYLDPTKGTWKDVIPFQNFDDLLKQYSEMPIYSIPFNFIYGSLKSIYSSYKNFKVIDKSLVDNYVKHANNPNQREQEPNFIETGWATINKIFDFTTDGNLITSLIDSASQLLGFPQGQVGTYINDKIVEIRDNLNLFVSYISNTYNYYNNPSSQELSDDYTSPISGNLENNQESD
jgi:hypothetical protein